MFGLFSDRWRSQVSINADQIAVNKAAAEAMRNLIKTNALLIERVTELEWRVRSMTVPDRSTYRGPVAM